MQTSTPSQVIHRELVLVGAGHAHVQVLRNFAMEGAPPGTRVTLVVDTPVAVYSGMVPGVIAGQYRPFEVEIDAVPLARRAGARIIVARATGVDPAARRIRLEGRPDLAYDLASFDIGSTVTGLDLPGVRAHAIATRPIGRFVARLGEIEAAARAHATTGKPAENQASATGARRLSEGGPSAGSSASTPPETPPTPPPKPGPSTSGAAQAPFRAVVVGGGAGGVEVAACLRARLHALDVPADVTLVHAGPRLLAGYADSFAARAAHELDARGIALRCASSVEGVAERAVLLDGGDRLPFDALLWVTGATSHGLFTSSGLSCDSRGFVLVRPTLQVLGFDDLFAAGDCATLADHPQTAKAGVYAVRQGPYLLHNLRALAAETPTPPDATAPGVVSTTPALRAYQPQRDFLTLLNFGDGYAIGSKWGRTFGGRWVIRLKDHIDRKFMAKFQVLAEDGGPGPAFANVRAKALAGPLANVPGRSATAPSPAPSPAPPPAWHAADPEPSRPEPPPASPSAEPTRRASPTSHPFDSDPPPANTNAPAFDGMICGGCAAKLSQSTLERTLARLGRELTAPPPAGPAGSTVLLGLAEADDVTAVRLPGGDVLIASVDGFRAFTDDPFLVGRVAAANAVSDLLAKGVAAHFAQAWITLPLGESEALASETLFQVLAGARATFDPLGVVLLGGHTSRGSELQVGFAIHGVAPADTPLLATRGALAAGQLLVLTRGLGTGVVLHADMAGGTRGPWLLSTHAALVAGHGAAPTLARQHGAVAATDITGFGLAGHLAAMLGPRSPAAAPGDLGTGFPNSNTRANPSTGPSSGPSSGTGPLAADTPRTPTAPSAACAPGSVAAELWLDRLPALPGALALLARGERSSFHGENARRRRTLAIPTALARDPRLELLFDPQTAGGLLLAVPADRAPTLVAALHAHGHPQAAIVGRVTPPRADGADFAVALAPGGAAPTS